MSTNPPKDIPFAGCRTAATQRRRTDAAISLLLLAMVAGCTGSEPTRASQDETNDLSTGVSTETPAPDLSPSFVTTSLTNQPSGFSRIAEWASSSMMPLNTCVTSGYGVLAGKWCRWYNSGGTTAYSDGTAPKSSAGTLRFKFPKGLSPGASYGMVSMWTPTSGTEYSKVYESGWVRIPSSNFEMHGPSYGLKMFGLWASGRKPGPNSQIVGWASGVGTNPVSAFKFVLKQQDFVLRNLLPNVDTRALFTAGKWHHYELLMETNTIGQANGKFKMWWNGVMTHNYSNVVYRTATYPAKFFGRKWDPVWGGAGGPSKSRDDYLLVDHVYISGVR
jgi:hypothetical protein